MTRPLQMIAAGGTWTRSVTTPMAIFAVSRMLLALLAAHSRQLLPPPRRHASPSVLPHSDPLAALWSWTSPWFHFDAAWYLGIVERGYHWGSLGRANTNFMPLYPALVRLVQPFLLDSAPLAGLVVANIAYLAALILLWHWALERWDRATAVRVLLLTVAFPFSIFFSMPYAESTFLALAVAAFLFAERDRWTIAICCAGLSTIARPVGLAVVVGIALMAYSRGRPRQALLACLAVLPLAGFALYLEAAFGHPLAFLTYHSAGWVPPRGGFLHTIEIQFGTKLAPFDRIDAACAVLFLLAGVACWRRLGPGYGAYVLTGVLLPLAHGLVSMERYVAVLFPVIALVATWKNALAQKALFALSLMLLALFTLMSASGYAVF